MGDVRPIWGRSGELLVICIHLCSVRNEILSLMIRGVHWAGISMNVRAWIMQIERESSLLLRRDVLSHLRRGIHSRL